MKVSIISYDVWGNAKDGYEVNQASYWHRNVDFDGDWENDREILKFLKDMDYLAKHVRYCDIEVEDSYNAVYLYRKRDYYPLGEVQLEGND